MTELIDEQYTELTKRFENLNDDVGGSGWVIDRWNYIFVDCLTIKPQRASSYIPTPVKYLHSRCGLIQTRSALGGVWNIISQPKFKHNDRTTVLQKIHDKYNYNISYPTTFEDIDRFAIDNQVSVFVYYISDDDSIRTKKRANPDYILNDVVYLLRIENDDNAHYIH